MSRLNVVNSLILINIIIFIIGYNVPSLTSHLALFFPENKAFHFWQLITYMFVHGSISHILFNMLGLWMFATPLERILGHKTFLFFYFACGVGGAMIYIAINTYQVDGLMQLLIKANFNIAQIHQMLQLGQYPAHILSSEQATKLITLYLIPTVGASGAIYGILVAYAVLFPNTKLILIFLPFPIAAKYFVPMLISLDLFSGVTGFSIFGGNVAHFAHIGGAVVGFFFIVYWHQKYSFLFSKKPENMVI